MEKLRNTMQRIPSRHQVEFFELSKCKFDHHKEAQILFIKGLLHDDITRSIKYFSLFSCRLCPNFIKEILVPYLTNNEHLIRFSFVLNNDSRVKQLEYEDGEVNQSSKKPLLSPNTTIDEDEID